MGKVTNSEDILAAVEGLSEDLSAIASNIGEQADPEDAPEVEETPETPAAEEAPEAPAAEEAPTAAEESVKAEEADPSGTAAALQKVLNNTLVFSFLP